MSEITRQPWLSDPEIDDLCDGLQTNAARRRHLESMGLHVKAKPNGRPLVMRQHAELVLSGLAQVREQGPAKATGNRPDRAALVLAFKKSVAA